MNILRNLIVFFTAGTLALILAVYFTGETLDDYLYKVSQELHYIYDTNDFNVNDYIDKINGTGEIISQYNYTSEDSLIIYTTKPEEFKEIPDTYLNITVKKFEYLVNSGVSTTLYTKGDNKKLISILNEYGDVFFTDINKGNIYKSSKGYMIIFLLSFGLFVYLLRLHVKTLSRQLLVQQLFGVEKWTLIKYYFRRILFLAILSLFSGSLGMFLSSFIGYSIKWSYTTNIFLTLFLLIGVIIFLYFSFVLFEYKNVKYKEKSRKKFYPIIHVSLLTISLFAYFVYIQDINQRIIYLTENSDYLETWNNTENIFKTNITNQLDRSNEIEELNYQKKAKKFYDLVSKKKETFIVDSYNFMYINDPSENKPLYVGSLVTEKNDQNYITSPSGNSITVDKNYLELNPIKTIESMNFSEESYEGTIYLIIPEKYIALENEIIKNYTYDLKWRLEDDGNSITPEFKVIHSKNNQEYFTYNSLTGDPSNGNKITDPIVVVLNENTTTNLFWGNIFVSDGGFFYKVNENEKFSAYEAISEELNLSGLSGILNFSISVYDERGMLINGIEMETVNNLLIILFLTCLIAYTLNHIIAVMFERNSKKIYIKYTFGYSYLDIFLDVAFTPVFIIFTVYLSVQILRYRTVNNFILLLMVILSIVEYYFLSKNFILEGRKSW